MSTISRRLGPGGKMYVPRDRYSLTMSFWVVPRSSRESTPWSAALATYRPSIHAAGALMVIDVFISPWGMPSSRVRMWPRWATGTPTFPTSPRAITWSGSYPVWVGRSKAIDRPVCPLARLVRYSWFDALAVEWPEYVRINHGRSLSCEGPSCEGPGCEGPVGAASAMANIV